MYNSTVLVYRERIPIKEILTMFGKQNRANAPTPDEHQHTWIADGTPYWRDGKFFIPQKCAGCPAKQVVDATPAKPTPSK